MKCFNWKVLVALAAVGVGVYALAPGLAAAAVPLLVLAVCPVSMLLMMRGMGSMGRCDTNQDAADANAEEVAPASRGGGPASRASPTLEG